MGPPVLGILIILVFIGHWAYRGFLVLEQRNEVDKAKPLPQTACPACGQAHDLDAPACPHCGYDYYAEAVCPYCGFAHDAALGRCPTCGYLYTE